MVVGSRVGLGVGARELGVGVGARELGMGVGTLGTPVGADVWTPTNGAEVSGVGASLPGARVTGAWVSPPVGRVVGGAVTDSRPVGVIVVLKSESRHITAWLMRPFVSGGLPPCSVADNAAVHIPTWYEQHTWLKNTEKLRLAQNTRHVFASGCGATEN